MNDEFLSEIERQEEDGKIVEKEKDFPIFFYLFTLILSLSVVVTGVIFNTATLSSLNNEASELDNNIATAQKSLSQRKDEIDLIQETTKLADKLLNIEKNNQPYATLLLREVEKILPEYVKIQEFKLDVDKQNLKFLAQVQNFEQVAEFVSILKRRDIDLLNEGITSPKERMFKPFEIDSFNGATVSGEYVTFPVTLEFNFEYFEELKKKGNLKSPETENDNRTNPTNDNNNVIENEEETEE